MVRPGRGRLGEQPMPVPRFTKHTIATVENNLPPAPMNTFHAVGDIDGDGRLDVAICGRDGRLVWLENRPAGEAWTVHLIDNVAMMECGGSLVDVTGDGRLDIVNGGDWRATQMWWWENPGAVGEPWTWRVIADTGHGQFHDTIVGEVNGVRSLAFTNQSAPGGTTVYCVPFPDDPTVSPWPGLQIIASAASEPNPYREIRTQPEEGLALGDLNGDGRNEIVCGTHWYEFADGAWRGHKFASGYISTKIAVGDVDGDGRPEIVLSEGDPCIYGKSQGGKVSWFKPGDDITAMWQEHVVEDFLLDAHSLQLGDLCGNGRLDILIGEVGVADPHTDEYAVRPPRLFVYENDGRGGFARHVIDEGTGTHEAVLADVWNRGVLDIVGKPLHGAEKWHVHVWANGSGLCHSEEVAEGG